MNRPHAAARATGDDDRMRAVDWMQIHARIEDAMRAVVGQVESTDEEVRQILRDRARALAKRADAHTEIERREFLEIGVRRERMLVESRCVIEVLRRVEPTPLPGARPPVAALVAWRGRILTALDLRLIAGVAGNGQERTLRLVVLGGDRPELGLLVDHVGDLEELPLASIRPASGQLRHDYASTVSDDARPVLDVELLLRRHANRS